MDIRLVFEGKSLDQLASDVERNLSRTPKADADDFVATAKRHVHQVTKRTMESIATTMEEGDTSGTVTGEYGAFWEEKRGEPHNFATQALEEVEPRALERAERAIEDAK